MCDGQRKKESGERERVKEKGKGGGNGKEKREKRGERRWERGEGRSEAGHWKPGSIARGSPPVAPSSCLSISSTSTCPKSK